MAIHFTRQAQQALTVLSQGHNLLLTGGPGSGKSTLIQALIPHFPRPNVLLLTATQQLQGLSVPAIFPATGELDDAARALLAHTDVLVIDDVHELDAAQLDRINEQVQQARGQRSCFGGLQVILLGDIYAARAPYFFDAQVLTSGSFQEVYLQQHWYTEDDRLVEIVQQLRTGTKVPSALEQLNDAVLADAAHGTPEPQGLLVSPAAATINETHTDALPGPHYKATTRVAGQVDTSNFRGTAALCYANGTQVMFIADDPQGQYRFGQFGVIVQAQPNYVQVQLRDNGQVATVYPYTWYAQTPALHDQQLVVEASGSVMQFPLIAAWAVTAPQVAGMPLPEATLDTAGQRFAPGALAQLLSQVQQRSQLHLTAPVVARQVLSDATLVRRVQRRHATPQQYSRLAFIAVDTVANTGASAQPEQSTSAETPGVYRVHVVILEQGQLHAEFGSWIYPACDISKLDIPGGNIPNGGLGLAPTLADFWPLLRRQVADALVIADGLTYLEQHATTLGIPELGLGAGYDAAEFGLNLSGTAFDRARSLAQGYLEGFIQVQQGVPAGRASSEDGALWRPLWAPEIPLYLDLQRTTDTDVAWVACNGGQLRPQEKDSVTTIVENLTAWAATRGARAAIQQEQLQQRVEFAAQAPVQLPELHLAQQIPALLTPGTKVAFSGTRNLGGQAGDDASLARLLADRALQYTVTVDREHCNVLIAADPSMSSEKIQRAQAFDIPVLSVSEFEQWYVHGPFLQAGDAAQPAAGNQQQSQEEPQLYDPAAALPANTRVAFHGPVEIFDQQLFPGMELAQVCRDLGLVYRPAVTKHECEVLVTTDPGGDNIPGVLAQRYHKRLVRTASFQEWAEQKLGAGYVQFFAHATPREPHADAEEASPQQQYQQHPGNPTNVPGMGAAPQHPQAVPPAQPTPPAQQASGYYPPTSTMPAQGQYYPNGATPQQAAGGYDSGYRAGYDGTPTAAPQGNHQPSQELVVAPETQEWEAPTSSSDKGTIAQSGTYFFGFASLTCFILAAVAHFISTELTKTMLVYGGISLGLAIPFGILWLIWGKRR